MTGQRTRLCAFAMFLGLALTIGLSAGPARAIEPYPGETQEAFAARAQLEQQAKLAAADAASGKSSSAGGAMGSALKLSAFGLVMLVVGGWRMSRGIMRASQKIAQAGGAGRAGESFEERLAERLRELERTDAIPTAPLPAAPIAAVPPPRAMNAGPRTFGKRVS